MNESKTYTAVDSSIGEHIKEAIGENVMAVGWVVVVATKEVGGENFDSNGFAHFTSEAFPEYSQVGLLQTVLDDKRNHEVAAGIGHALAAMMSRGNSDDE